MNKFIFVFLLISVVANAQTLRQRNFVKDVPTTQQETEWEREIYREIDLYEVNNAGLYSSQTATSNQQGLFKILFELAVARTIPVYNYNIDGGITLNKKNVANIEDVLLNHGILYSVVNDSIVVDDDEIPSEDVTAYYVKEKVFYNSTNARFQTKITALCPIIVRVDDLNDNKGKYPLFWIDFQDIKPYLENITIIPNYRNQALRMPMSDYFALRLYKGKVYKDGTAFYRQSANISNVDSLSTENHIRIENELAHVQAITYNTFADSIQREPVRPRKRLLKK